ncbi:ATP synthase subunit G atp20 [Diatrype stigma]|uniref:ATP synthase subunit G atp20 n=1 Tax=Diatrype stigma TaxID=117547 RepID=A0AAN9URX8_9PEZI
MSSAVVARPMLLRQSRVWGRTAARRFESTAQSSSGTSTSTANSAAKKATEKATETAKDSASKVSSTVSEYSSKAAQGLSKVSATAGPAITSAAKGVAQSLSKVGGRTGRLVSFVEKHTPTVVFYSKVGAELAKIVFRGQKMSPPSLSTFQSFFQNAYKTYLQNPNALLETASKTASKVAQQPGSLLQQARSINRAQLVAGGVVAAECLGFFTVGEMIGRFKIVGYHGGNPAAHH